MVDARLAGIAGRGLRATRRQTSSAITTLVFRRRRKRGATHRLAPGSVLFASGLACSSPALACPDCAVGRAARAAVWNDGFFPQLCLVLLPLVLIGAIAAVLYRIGMPAAGRDRS